MTRNPQPPFEIGDRVDHPKFGISTVCEPAEGGPDLWKITIQPDASGALPKTISHNLAPGGKQFLTLVASPEAKGSRYWQHKWEALLAEFDEKSSAKARHLHSAFNSREANGFISELQALREAEQVAEAKLISFMRDEEEGRHV